MPLPANNNGDFSRIVNPTRDQLYGCRSETVHVIKGRIGRTRIEIEEEVAVRGCFVDGHRRIFKITKAAGRVDLGAGLSGSAREVICWGTTQGAALLKAKQILETGT